jgi:hypothetical protein
MKTTRVHRANCRYRNNGMAGNRLVPGRTTPGTAHSRQERAGALGQSGRPALQRWHAGCQWQGEIHAAKPGQGSWPERGLDAALNHPCALYVSSVAEQLDGWNGWR